MQAPVPQAPVPVSQTIQVATTTNWSNGATTTNIFQGPGSVFADLYAKPAQTASTPALGGPSATTAATVPCPVHGTMPAPASTATTQSQYSTTPPLGGPLGFNTLFDMSAPATAAAAQVQPTYQQQPQYAMMPVVQPQYAMQPQYVAQPQVLGNFATQAFAGLPGMTAVAPATAAVQGVNGYVAAPVNTLALGGPAQVAASTTPVANAAAGCQSCGASEKPNEQTAKEKRAARRARAKKIAEARAKAQAAQEKLLKGNTPPPYPFPPFVNPYGRGGCGGGRPFGAYPGYDAMYGAGVSSPMPPDISVAPPTITPPTAQAA